MPENKNLCYIYFNVDLQTFSYRIWQIFTASVLLAFIFAVDVL
jgi:hypothetical protein